MRVYASVRMYVRVRVCAYARLREYLSILNHLTSGDMRPAVLTLFPKAHA